MRPYRHNDCWTGSFASYAGPTGSFEAAWFCEAQTGLKGLGPECILEPPKRHLLDFAEGAAFGVEEGKYLEVPEVPEVVVLWAGALAEAEVS